MAAMLDFLPSSLVPFTTAVVSGDLTADVAVPVWAVLAGGTVIIILLIARLFGTQEGGGLWRLALVALLAVVAWRGFDLLEQHKVQAARAALAERVARAIAAPSEANPLLACAGGVSNAELRAACERTVFARPEHAAAAVTLVKDRLDLLALAADPVAGLGPDDPRTARLRRSLEADDFGLVGHVLVDVEGCRPDACVQFALFRDAAKIQANMAARTFEGLVEKQAASWSPARPAAPPAALPVATPAAELTPAPVPPAPAAAPVVPPPRPEPPKPAARPAPRPQAVAPVQPAAPRPAVPAPLTLTPAAPQPAPAETRPSNQDN
ncbi:hypothetical protein [Blastochloris viridis]|nr:hypothetical protein [Blastochloris viridis]